MTDNSYDAAPPVSNQPGAYSPNGYSQPGGASPKKTLSIISMITGILGVLAILTTWPAVILGLVAVILGHLGQRKEKVAGKGFWITGLITGYIAIVGGIVVLIAAIAILTAAQNGDFGPIPTN